MPARLHACRFYCLPDSAARPSSAARAPTPICWFPTTVPRWDHQRSTHILYLCFTCRFCLPWDNITRTPPACTTVLFNCTPYIYWFGTTTMDPRFAVPVYNIYTAISGFTTVDYARARAPAEHRHYTCCFSCLPAFTSCVTCLLLRRTCGSAFLRAI